MAIVVKIVEDFSHMDPKLVGLSGLLRGEVVTLIEQPLSFGRDSCNQQCIDSLLVSRRHCVIRKEDDLFKIVDLGSTNGTFVNGVPIKERVLEHGDEIRIGDSLLHFSCSEERPTSSMHSVEMVTDSLVPESTLEASLENAFDLDADDEQGSNRSAARLVRELNTLVKFGTELNSIREVDSLTQRLLESVLDIVPAERGAVLLVGKGRDELVPSFTLDKASGRREALRVSRTVVERVLDEGVAIMSNDVAEGEELDKAKSLISSGVRSVLAVPLMVLERSLGVIYLDSTDPEIRFDERHLKLMTALASVAAPALDSALHVEWLESERQRLLEDVRSEHDLVGESRVMGEVHEFIAKVASASSTVLICGESGTGKEVVAQMIHAKSPRSDKPFVAINCAALTETLLESELFGHERGAFTGAVTQKRGKLERAHTGTLFLDEVGDLASSSQAKLLRVLQEHEFERVGGTRPIKVDVRVIAATNKDLNRATQDGSFRGDLYYRLNVVSLTMPALRDRRGDIPLLANYFVAKQSARCNRHVMGISAASHEYLAAYGWPGNVRELENAVERAVVLGSGDQILPEDLPETVLEGEPLTDVSKTRYHEAIKGLKKDLILKALKETDGNHVKAAELMGVHSKYLHRLIRNMKLKPATRGH